MPTPVFNYERAAIIVAEAELFGDKQVCERWGVSGKSITRYRQKAINDPKLSVLVQLKKQLLVKDWQQDATKTIKVALSELQRRMPLATKEDDAKVIHAIAGACKIVGELKIASEALNESEQVLT